MGSIIRNAENKKRARGNQQSQHLFVDIASCTEINVFSLTDTGRAPVKGEFIRGILGPCATSLVHYRPPS